MIMPCSCLSSHRCHALILCSKFLGQKRLYTMQLRQALPPSPSESLGADDRRCTHGYLSAIIAPPLPFSWGGGTFVISEDFLFDNC